MCKWTDNPVISTFFKLMYSRWVEYHVTFSRLDWLTKIIYRSLLLFKYHSLFSNWLLSVVRGVWSFGEPPVLWKAAGKRTDPITQVILSSLKYLLILLPNKLLPVLLKVTPYECNNIYKIWIITSTLWFTSVVRNCLKGVCYCSIHK